MCELLVLRVKYKYVTSKDCYSDISITICKFHV
jgi:hypothetical protein